MTDCSWTDCNKEADYETGYRNLRNDRYSNMKPLCRQHLDELKDLLYKNIIEPYEKWKELREQVYEFLGSVKR